MMGPEIFRGAAPEIGSVVFAALLVWASALVQHVGNVVDRGVGYVMSDRSVAPDTSGFFGRATRTLANNIESALMYVPPTLLVIAQNKNSELTSYAACVYIAARLLFTLTYWLKLSKARSSSWAIGMACCAVMLYVALPVHGTYP
jgi:uncharacterized MAPEG superfamily protein